MNIQEATKKAMEQNGVICRDKFVIEKGIKQFRMAVVAPGNSLDTCPIMTMDEKGRLSDYCRCWNPTADDLMADDWEVMITNNDIP